MKVFSISILRTLMAAFVFLAMITPPAVADGKSQAAKEAAEFILARFGRQAAKDGVQALARRIEQSALRHGDSVFRAVRRLGPTGLHLIEQAGPQGAKVAKLLAGYGEHAAVWVVNRPKGMALFLKHGEEAASVLVKHKGLAEPVIEHFGEAGVRALRAVGTQGGRRIAMLVEGGELAKIGRTPELLHVVGTYGEKAMDFVWKHKQALAVTAALGAFLANPEPFIEGTRDIAEIVAQNVVKPIADMPAIAVKEGAGEMARRTNWTLVFLTCIALLALLVAARWRPWWRSAFTPDVPRPAPEMPAHAEAEAKTP